MLRRVRFYYHFLLTLITKKFRTLLVLSILLIIFVIGVKYVVVNAAPNLYQGLYTHVSKPRYNEGIIGAVETLNPVYAESLAEKEINSLVFRGLTKVSEGGQVEPDLAESFSQPTPTKYVFKLRENLFWHDGEEITADDVVHTVDLTQNDDPPSELSANFRDVVVTKKGDYTIEFQLKEPFAPFILNTTIGIVPQHISLEEYRPVGSGDFEVKSLSEDKIVLESDFAILVLKLYKSKEDALLALKLGEIDSLGGLSFFEIEELRFWPNLNIFANDLTLRQVMLFFNTKHDLLKEKVLRQALELSTSKELTAQVLPGFNQQTASTSLPLGNWADNSFKSPYSFDTKKADEAFDKLGWKMNGESRVKKGERLSLEITISDEPELKEVSESIAQSWREVGVEVDLKTVDLADLKERIIPERDFQILLSVQELSSDPDQYSLWHSSQTNDANITFFSSDKIDKILEDGRKILDINKRKEKYELFNRLLADETPAIFLYYPKYFWVANKRIEGISPSSLIQTSDRFKDIQNWKIKSFSIL